MKVSPKLLAISAGCLLLVVVGLIYFTTNGESPDEPKNATSRPAQDSGGPIPIPPEPGPQPARTQDTPQANATTINSTTPQASLPVPSEPAGPKPDKMVSFDFISDLAKYIVSQYHPKGSRPKAKVAAYLSLDFKSLNMRYGTRMTGLEVGGPDIARAREEVLDYVFFTPVLKALYKLYDQGLVDSIVFEGENAQATYVYENGTREAKPLTYEQIAELLNLCADELRENAAVFKTLVDNPVLIDMVARYRQAQLLVQQANTKFQTTLKSLSGPGEGQFKDVPEWQRKKEINRTGMELKNALMTRERVREELVQGLKSACKPECADDSNLFYISQWVYRRVEFRPENIKVLGEAAKLMDDLADQMHTRATSLRL